MSVFRLPVHLVRLRNIRPPHAETVSLLSSIYASSGENHGVTRTLGVYGSEVLENARLNGASYPWYKALIRLPLTV